GGGLGFSGIPGIAVALDEYKGTGAPSANFIGISDGPTSAAAPDVLHWLATSNLAVPIQNASTHVKVVDANGTTTVFVNGTQVISQAVALPASAYIGFSAGTGGLTNRHAVSKLIVNGEPPAPASLNVGVALSAPLGSEQAATKLAVSGTCPSSFTTAALGSKESATPALTGAVAGAACNVAEAAPTGGGWTATASVNGGAPVALTAAEGKYKVPAFALAGGVNSVQFTNTYTAPTPASLNVGVAVKAPAGSEQLAQTFLASGSCPSSFTTVALASGASATPALTGAVAGASCSVSEAAPSASGWTATASVNGGTPVSLTASAGKFTVSTFALLGGTNTVQFTNTYTPAAPVTVPDPSAGGWTFNGSAALSGTELVLTGATKFQRGDGMYPTAIDPRSLTVEFDASITGGTGADGMALFFADVSKGAKTTQVGVEGGGLGFSGIPGIAIALDEYKGTGAPSANFIGISDGPTSTATPDVLHWLATANLSAAIQGATTHVKVVNAGGTTTVFVNGTQVLSQAVALPTSAYLGFSAGTGGLTNRHAVSKVIVTSP
ncbi:MAG TPA: DUF5979 domain-containing protein, partial [Solirubrobacteraceae bacterium]|nr:DUF5979 domain-containing protein [Solirubrobacteraceae bacterium]